MRHPIPSPIGGNDAPVEVTLLSQEELDRTVGGDLFSLAVMFFAAGAVVGMLDRMIFGGCRCR